MKKNTVRVAAVGDIHVGEHSRGKYRNLFIEVSEKADILLLCGDLTIRGLPAEIEVLLEDAANCKIPILAVLGNHDCEEGQETELVRMLDKGGIRVLDGTTYEYKGVGFAGVKGFCGGFDRYMLSSWGEHAIKDFVYEGVQETLKLERALESMQADKKVVLLHYSPIRQTVEGEPPEIFPYLGSSRLEEPINRFGVQAVFHGHAHHGTMQGKTMTGIPVFNISLPLLTEKQHPTQYYLFEV